MLRQTGNLFALGLDIVRGLFQRPFQLRLLQRRKLAAVEVDQQCVERDGRISLAGEDLRPVNADVVGV